MGAEMKILGLAGLFAISASAASSGAAPFATAKSIEQFAQCFANAQDRAGKAWWFVPKQHGGTFSDLGATAVRAAYLVTIDDRGSKREIRVPQGSADSAEVVRRCI